MTSSTPSRCSYRTFRAINRGLSSLGFLGIVAIMLTGCNSLQTLSVTPVAGGVNLTTVGETAQYKAVGTYQMGYAPATSGDATAAVSWTSSSTAVATINASGLATATGVGTSIITAELNGKAATSDVTVTIATVAVPNPVLTVSPNTGLAVVTHLGDTIQFIAYGNLTGGGALQDLTSRVSWVSSNAGVATISASGLATAKGVGNTTVTAGFSGKTVTTDLTVSTAAILAPQLAIIPSLGGATALQVGETTQFLAFGALGDGPTLQDLTNRVRWVSSDVAVATIDAAGLATAVGVPAGSSTTTITAITTTVSGSILNQISSLTVTAPGTVTLPTLALYKVGGGGGTVTSLPVGVSCGPQATCTGNFPLGASVTLTAVPDAVSSFGGWSSNCIATSPNSPTAPNLSCTVAMGNNTSVGAIFNRP